RILDGPTILTPPPPVSANPLAPPPDRPLPDKTEGGSLGTPATSPDSGTSNPLPGADFSPSHPPSSSPSEGGGVSVVANPAELSVEMLPETSIVVGSRVSFRVSAKKPGFLVLMDVDSTGKVTQIYPSPVSLMTGRGNPNTNFVRPGKPIQIPSP